MTAAYRFGRFELRPATRQLLVDQQPAMLGARAFDLLLALIERRDRLVTKNELLELVWPGLVVEENNLQVQVSALRKLLGPEAIATVAGRGYRFTLEPTQAEAPLPSPVRIEKHNLPAQVSSFIGRERELTDLRAMLAQHRLVTLVGVGGIGKTRLALQLAASVADAYADGVWFVDLAPLSDPRHAANAVASALGVREDPGSRSSQRCNGSSRTGRCCWSSTTASIFCSRARNWHEISCRPVEASRSSRRAVSRSTRRARQCFPWRRCPCPIRGGTSRSTRWADMQRCGCFATAQSRFARISR